MVVVGAGVVSGAGGVVVSGAGEEVGVGAGEEVGAGDVSWPLDTEKKETEKLEKSNNKVNY